jgi:hypothetical protein
VHLDTAGAFRFQQQGDPRERLVLGRPGRKRPAGSAGARTALLRNAEEMASSDVAASPLECAR